MHNAFAPNRTRRRITASSETHDKQRFANGFVRTRIFRFTKYEKSPRAATLYTKNSAGTSDCLPLELLLLSFLRLPVVVVRVCVKCDKRRVFESVRAR